ncbi:hypothetical protein J7F03_27665 [Streptomyces sp. ISL-43]|uniref:hypothetical protein n=1 Tax=Streptomyces sp. ISL-43 TaxID=2819183 RepID=UPI001BE9E43D|nr:hypothetical protein [Streptomyces sp. ISL-43]MBT2450783.1 hypothetical protein [Streptomyces sp. ISL-43]
MNNSRAHRVWRKARAALVQLRRLPAWAHRRRRAAAAHLFRGVCYGIGTALVGTLTLWLQNRT